MNLNICETFMLNVNQNGLEYIIHIVFEKKIESLEL